MDNQNGYFASLSVLLLGSTVMLSALQENNLSVYLSVFLVSYFACSLKFEPKKRVFDYVGLALLVVWAFAVVLSIINAEVLP